MQIFQNITKYIITTRGLGASEFWIQQKVYYLYNCMFSIYFMFGLFLI